MKIEDKRQFIGELFFLLGTILYITYYFFYIAYYWYVEKDPTKQIPIQRLFYISVVCFIIKLILTKYQLKEVIIGAIGAVLMYMCWKNSGGIDYPVNYLIILAMKNVDLKKVMKAVFCCGVIALIYGFTWFFVNAPDQLTRIKDYGRGLVEVRYKFCTWHANTMHLMVFILIISFLYVFYKKLEWWAYITLLYFNYEFFQLTKSRTEFYCTTIAIIAYAILKYGKKIYELKISVLLIELANLAVILMSLYYGIYADMTDANFIKLDSLLTGRFSVARYCFLQAKIPLFGSNIGGRVCGYGIYMQANDGYVTELGNVRTLLEYGPIVLVLFCALLFIGIWVLHKKGYFDAMILLEMVFIVWSVEAYFPAAYNLKAFVFGLAFYQFMELCVCKRRKKANIEQRAEK